MKRHGLGRPLIGGLALVIGYGLAGATGAAGAAVTPPSSVLPPSGGLAGPLMGPHSLGSGLLPGMNTSNSTLVGAQQAELYSVDGQASGQAGYSVSISGSLAAVGAPAETANGNS